ncbi:hypothetical protein K6U06_14620 [Acidiferrimicrobium sp. IK]|uniref:hypothetical protein n=1 Tax=Acidiferrimicrobium sp. IK TaxID=2871700 RepID=UPI0021CB144B|nr:hypothetical protein [Acidiferrimicrobium sp. IK]MCU4185599.1 hypothetical protein [Acidiferrimicrobium sp. IK]
MEITLPEGWAVLDLRGIEPALREVERETVGAAREQVDRLLSVESFDPDLVAVLSVPLTDDAGGLLATMRAALVAVMVDANAVLPAGDEVYAPRVVPRVPLVSEREISVLVQTFPVWSIDGVSVVLLNFSSPSVALADLLVAGFTRIAATARVLMAPGSSSDAGL